MAFRHFGNIAGGSVLTSLVYSALATVSAAVLGLVGKSVIVGVLVLTVGAALLYSGVKTKSWRARSSASFSPRPAHSPF